MTDAMEIVVALTKIADAILELAKAHRSIAYESAKCVALLGELNEKIKVEEIEE
jgi:hypothetical protein